MMKRAMRFDNGLIDVSKIVMVLCFEENGKYVFSVELLGGVGFDECYDTEDEARIRMKEFEEAVNSQAPMQTKISNLHTLNM